MRLLSTIEADWQRTVNSQADKMGIAAGKYEAHPTALVEHGTVIGKGVVVEPLAAIMRGAVIGENTLVSSGAIVGAHGPALYKCLDGTTLSWARIHFGTVQIGSQCELGSQTIVLKAMLGRTRMENNVVLGNMVHIGHGAYVGERVWMAARVTVCGHAFINHDVSIGAGSTIRDNVHIGPAASVGMGSVVVSSVPAGKTVLGVPAKESHKAV
jgi:UDP-3-O-[3-hydroxymyristoyl] glucosamine N-acyltransferase